MSSLIIEFDPWTAESVGWYKFRFQLDTVLPIDSAVGFIYVYPLGVEEYKQPRSVPGSSFKLEIYNIYGKRLFSSSSYEAWNKNLPSGIYFARIKGRDFKKTEKIIHLR